MFTALMEPAGRFITAGTARTSPLIWRLLGRDTSRPWDEEASPQRSVPTDHVDRLDAEARTLLIEWIDLGAQWGSESSNGAER